MTDMITLLASTDWAPFFQTVIGALIGAFGAVAGGAFGSWFTWQKERQSVAAALSAEVQGFVEVMKWRRTRDSSARDYKFDDHPFPVFEANVGKIGFLPPDLASDVAGFYSYARGVAQELNKGGPIKSHSQFVMLSDLASLEVKGEFLVSDLQKEAARTWQDYLQPP